MGHSPSSSSDLGGARLPRRCSSPPAARAHHSLDQRAMHSFPAWKRAEHLQRASQTLLGMYGADADRPLFSIGFEDAAGGAQGYVQLGPWRVDTSAVLGWSKSDGEYSARVAGVDDHSKLSGSGRRAPPALHVRMVAGDQPRGLFDLERRLPPPEGGHCPTAADIKAIPSSIVAHVRLKHPTGPAAKRHNPLQRLAYLGVICLA